MTTDNTVLTLDKFVDIIFDNSDEVFETRHSDGVWKKETDQLENMLKPILSHADAVTLSDKLFDISCCCYRVGYTDGFKAGIATVKAILFGQ